MAVTLSSLGLLFVFPAFWSGLPVVLAAGGIVLGWAGLDGNTRRRLSRAAVVIGALALAADVGIFVLDWLSTNGIISI